MKKPVTIEDIVNIRSITDLQLSPAGTYAVFTMYTSDRKKNVNARRLYLLDRKKSSVRQLTYTADHGCVLWEDDHTLLMETVRKDDDKAEKLEEKTSFYRLNVEGGEAYPAFAPERTVLEIRKITDGIYAAKVEEDLNRLDPKMDRDAAEEELDYHVITEVPFRSDGIGYIDGKHNGLYIFREADGSFLRINPENTDVRSYTIQNTKIAYIAAVRKAVADDYSMLYIYDTKTKQNIPVVEDGELGVHYAAFREKDLVFLAADMKQWGMWQLKDWYAADPETGKYSLLRKNTEEFAFGDKPFADTIRPGGICFRSLGDEIYFTAMVHYHSDLYRYNKDNTIELVQSAEEGCFVCFDIDKQGIVAIQMPLDGLNVLTVNGKTVYDPNEELLADREISRTIPEKIVSRNGDEVEGWVLKPVNFDPDQKYPCVLQIHGGPRLAYGRFFFHEMQLLASKGMFVVFCNPHGSEGYGEAFADLRGKYGTIDFEDLMDFLDAMIERYPQIDTARLGACGGSYGGFMCNWIEGHTDRFAAIASQRSISNWMSDYGNSEIGMTFDFNEMGTDPWHDPAAVWNASPLKYAYRAKTPILFIHATVDYNCCIEQGAQMFAAMKHFGVPSRLVVFEGEGHYLSRVGKPKHKLRRLKEITDWLDRYLSGQQM